MAHSCPWLLFLRQVSPADFTRRDNGFVENSTFLRSPDCRPHYSMQGTQVMSPVTCGVVSAGHVLAYTGPSVWEQVPHTLINPFFPLREVSMQESKSNQERGELPQEGAAFRQDLSALNADLTSKPLLASRGRRGVGQMPQEPQTAGQPQFSWAESYRERVKGGTNPARGNGRRCVTVKASIWVVE